MKKFFAIVVTAGRVQASDGKRRGCFVCGAEAQAWRDAPGERLRLGAASIEGSEKSDGHSGSCRACYGNSGHGARGHPQGARNRRRDHEHQRTQVHTRNRRHPRRHGCEGSCGREAVMTNMDQNEFQKQVARIRRRRRVFRPRP